MLSMFAIVMHHYAYHGTLSWANYNAKYSGSLRINLFLHYFGKLGVVIFVMNGAFFLCEKRFNFKRPINLALTMFFYSFTIFIFMKYVIKLNMSLWFPYSWRDLLLPFT